jgi:hypothetical protein
VSPPRLCIMAAPESPQVPQIVFALGDYVVARPASVSSRA